MRRLVIIERFKAMNRWSLALVVFLIILATVLAIRASDEYRWSDWGFGDAQTMLSLRQWEEGGWIHNYLLFKPQGYAKAVDLLDEPELRHHAHGTCPGSSPRVGPRLLYTHYPAGYLIPYAILFRVGLDGLVAARMLSLLFSFGALVLMYLVFAKFTSPKISFTAVLFYGLSSAFLGYADSLANQPLDDLLRFGFMLAVVMATRSGSEQHRSRWMVAAWIMEFILSLVSFDSVFFLYAWLIGWDLLEKRGFRWKTYLLFSLAPISAHSLQFLQNVWYLGWNDAFIDIKDAFLLKNGADQGYNVGQGRLVVIVESLYIMFDNMLKPIWITALVAALYAVYAAFLRDQDKEFPTLKLLAILLLCGLAFVLVLPHAARMPYEARQMVPFVSLLMAGFTWTFPSVFKRSMQHGEEGGEPTAVPDARIAVPYLLLAPILLLIMWSRFAFSDRTPIYELGMRKEEMKFAQQLPNLPTRYEPIYFDMGAFSIYWDPKYVPGFPQILPLTEYYAGSSPILCFNEAEKAAEDIVTMIRLGAPRFSPIIIARNAKDLDRVIDALERAGALSAKPDNVRTAMGRNAIDLTDFIKWGDREADTNSRKP